MNVECDDIQAISSVQDDGACRLYRFYVKLKKDKWEFETKVPSRCTSGCYVRLGNRVCACRDSYRADH